MKEPENNDWMSIDVKPAGKLFTVIAIILYILLILSPICVIL